jgi:hypothetical protein
MYFVITVPHAQCVKEHLDKNWHLCDTLAIHAADSFSTNLTRKNISFTFPFVGFINRTTVDLNRPESRYTDFRMAINNELDKHQDIFVVDVHSFDDRAPWCSNSICPTVVFLDGQTEHKTVQMGSRKSPITGKFFNLPELIKDELDPSKKTKVDVGRSSLNDIVKTAMEHPNVRGAVLIEFNEQDFDSKKENLSSWVSDIIDSIISLSKKGFL